MPKGPITWTEKRLTSTEKRLTSVEAENERLTECWDLYANALEKEIERLQARIEELKKINYNLTRDNLEQANLIAVLKDKGEGDESE